VAAERQSLCDGEALDDLDTLHIHALRVARFRSEKTRRAERAGHGDNQVLHAAREVGRGERGALAEVGGESAVVLARNLGLQVGTAEVRVVQLVECGRAKTFAVTAAQRGRQFFNRNRDRPRGADLLAELAVAIDAKSAGDKNVAVEKTPLLFEVAGVLLTARAEQAYRRDQGRGRHEVREHRDAIRADPSILEVESAERGKAGAPGVDRLDKSATSLVGNAILLAAHVACIWRRGHAQIL